MAVLAGITFAGITVPGVVEAVRSGPPRLQVRRTQHWGVEGASEIVGLPGERSIVIAMTIAGELASFAALDALLNQLARAVGQHGELIHNDNGNSVTRTWQSCTFEGFVPRSPPLRDLAATLDPDGGWSIEGDFSFTQLIIDES